MSRARDDEHLAGLGVSIEKFEEGFKQIVSESKINWSVLGEVWGFRKVALLETPQKMIEGFWSTLRAVMSSIQPDMALTSAEGKLIHELCLLSKLLERCYIYSTDIEYAQFYNKELALRVDQVLSQIQSERPRLELHSESALVEESERIFTEIENNKLHYFR